MEPQPDDEDWTRGVRNGHIGVVVAAQALRAALPRNPTTVLLEAMLQALWHALDQLEAEAPAMFADGATLTEADLANWAEEGLIDPA